LFVTADNRVSATNQRIDEPNNKLCGCALIGFLPLLAEAPLAKTNTSLSASVSCRPFCSRLAYRNIDRVQAVLRILTQVPNGRERNYASGSTKKAANFRESAGENSEEASLEKSSLSELDLKNAIVSLWTRESELSGYERLKLKSLLLNLKALWVSNYRTALPQAESKLPSARSSASGLRIVSPVDRVNR
jgi:hypothetical protein